MITAEMDPEHRAVLLSDFRHGQRAFSFYVLLKASVYERLPLVLASIAHPDVAVARRMGLQILDHYDALSAVERAALHRAWCAARAAVVVASSRHSLLDSRRARSCSCISRGLDGVRKVVVFVFMLVRIKYDSKKKNFVISFLFMYFSFKTV